MSYGLKIFNSSGTATLDVSNRLTRLLYERDLPYNESSSTTVTGLDSDCVYFAINIEAGATAPEKFPHLISVSGTTVTWTAFPNSSFAANTKLIIFKYK